MATSPAITLTNNQYEPEFQSTAATSAALTVPPEHTYTAILRATRYTIVFRGVSLPAWVRPTISVVAELQSLEGNWDSYGAKPISRDLLRQALNLLSAVMRGEFDTPAIVPMSDGGVQLEWHKRQQDLEIIFSPDDAPEFFYRSRATGEERNGPVSHVEALSGLVGRFA